MEVLVVVADVNEGPEELMREDQLEGLSVLFHRVQKPEESEAKNLHLVLRLHVVSGVLTLYKVKDLE